MPSLLFISNFEESKVELNSKRVTIYYQIFKQKSASERTYENTKSDIEYRGLLDLSGECGRDSSLGSIELNKDYILDSNDGNVIEMKEQN